jgi:hypothetical protein
MEMLRRSQLSSQEIGPHLRRIVFLVFVLNLAMAAQTSPMHGTTLVISISQDEIILAADSRGVQEFGRYTLAFDSMCKIGILGHRAMFALSGVEGECNLGGSSCSRSGRDLVRDLFKGMDRSNSNVAERLADEWAESMSEMLVRYHRIPSHWHQLVEPGLPETTAIFASADEHGVMQAAYVQIFRDYPLIQPTSIRVDKHVAPISALPRGKWTLATGGSGGSLAFEFALGRTPRAIAERNNWPAVVVSQSGSARQMEQNAIRLVDLSIQFFPARKGMPSDVGYPIDAARLTSSGVSWVQRKEDCN